MDIVSCVQGPQILTLDIAGRPARWIGWDYGRGISRYAFAVRLPFTAAVLWGVFAVPDDPSRSGEAIVQVPGVIRLLIEFTFFAAATWSLFATGATTLGWIYGVAVSGHYLASYDRVVWLGHQ